MTKRKNKASIQDQNLNNGLTDDQLRQLFFSKCIDRDHLGEWIKKGKKNTIWKARDLVEKIVTPNSFNQLPSEKKQELQKIILMDAKKYGFDRELKKRFKNW